MSSMNSTAMSMMNSTGGMAGTQSVSTPNGMVMMHVVQVSDTDGNKLFNPDTITANPGDMVQFHFYPMNHSVAQSSFASPCEPLAQGNASATGFWSGFMPVTAANKTMPVYTITVNDTNPIWFYCATAMHCQMGMSGVINAPKGKTIAMYQSAAQSVAKSGVPALIEGGVASTNTTTNGNLSNNPGSDIGGSSSGSSASGSGNGSPSSTSSAGAASQSKSGGVKTKAMGSAMALVGVAVAVVVIG